jgi:hypothetical protein
MPYLYPDFASVAAIRQEVSKRLSLEIILNTPGEVTWLIIQKNPSKANEAISDHTINRVLNYLFLNRNRYKVLESVGRVVFLNLIPLYETYSSRLAHRNAPLEDIQNLRIIDTYLQPGSPCIIAWGNPPTGLAKPYAQLSEKVLKLLDSTGNPTYRVGELTRLGYPRHGQIWGSADPLQRMDPLRKRC